MTTELIASIDDALETIEISGYGAMHGALLRRCREALSSRGEATQSDAEAAIREHNDGCDEACKARRPIQGGDGCGYQTTTGKPIYGHRRCPECPLDWKIERATSNRE